MSYFTASGLNLFLSGKRVLEDVSFELARGSFTALLGPNGSGKSTLLKICSGVIEPGTGSISFEGRDLSSISARDRARVTAYVAPELTAEFPLTARETVMLGRIAGGGGLLTLASAKDEEAVRASMERCQCWELRGRELHSLSDGERQRVALAKAFVQQPKVLFLDETLSRMDLDHQARIGLMLKALSAETGLAVVLVAHDVNLATEWAESCLLLKTGKLVASGPVSRVWTTENLRALYPESELRIEAGAKPRVFLS